VHIDPKHIIFVYVCYSPYSSLHLPPTGDLTFEEFAKSSLGEELMPPEEVATELVVSEEGRSSGEEDDQSSIMDTTKQAEEFASELNRSTTLRKRHLMASSLGVSAT